MKTFETSSTYLEENKMDDASVAYNNIINTYEEHTQSEIFEAADFLLSLKKEHPLAEKALVRLFKEGYNQKEIVFSLMEYNLVVGFDDYSILYKKNVECLKKYKYIARKDFAEFNKLRFQFNRFGSEGVILFDPKSYSFGRYVNVLEKTINPEFLDDLKNPIAVSNVYSKYELDYLINKVRESTQEDSEKRLYLYYADWEKFCSYLQLIDFTELIKDERIVIAFENKTGSNKINDGRYS